MLDQPGPAPNAEAPSKVTKQNTSLSRRDFARGAVLASAVASIAPMAVVAAPSSGAATPKQDPPPARPPASVGPQNLAPNGPRLSAESQSEADARFQSILVLYGARFSNEQKNELHRLCAAVQPSLDHIRAYKIENGDGPALYLKPQYEREKKAKAVAGATKGPAGTSGSQAKATATGNGSKKP